MSLAVSLKGGAGLKVDDLRGLLQPKPFHVSIRQQ